MSDAPEIPRLDGESEPAWAAFLAWAALGPGRTYPAAAEALGRPQTYTRQIKRWSKDHRWKSRITAWDQAEIEAGRAKRAAAREAALRILADGAAEAAQIVRALAVGEHSPGSKPSVQLQAAIHVLAQAGLVPPKRTELVIDEADPLDPYREAMGDLTRAQLLAILALPDDSAGDDG